MRRKTPTLTLPPLAASQSEMEVCLVTQHQSGSHMTQAQVVNVNTNCLTQQITVLSYSLIDSSLVCNCPCMVPHVLPPSDLTLLGQNKLQLPQNNNTTSVEEVGERYLL
jgi:hypothetical protein